MNGMKRQFIGSKLNLLDVFAIIFLAVIAILCNELISIKIQYYYFLIALAIYFIVTKIINKK